MEKLKLHTPDITTQNIEKLAELFPSCMTETRDEQGRVTKGIDFDQLRQELSGSIIDGPRERYQLDWPGKREAILAANAPIAKTLRPCREESVDFDTTKNLFIEGDNLDALKLLQETYLGKVKMIYIDPSYNTGNDFLYEDDFAENTESYLLKSNQLAHSGDRLIANTDANGRFHSDWLSSLYPRLRLARTLLSDDGVIFISIDDNEASNLKLICDEVFGATNYLVSFYVQVRYADKTLAERNDYQKLVEQILVYQRSAFVPNRESEQYSLENFCWRITELTKGEQLDLGHRKATLFKDGEWSIQKIKPSINELKETWATGSVLKVNASGKFFGDFIASRKATDGLGCLYKVEGIGDDGIGHRYFTGPKREDATKGKFFSGVPSTRRKELSAGSSLKYKPIPNLYDFSDAFGNCRHEGTVEFGAGKKPIKLLQKLIDMATKQNENHMVVDFYAGSGSTGHAVLAANATDGGNRRFLLVQLGEKIENGEFDNISELTKERLRRSGSKLREAGSIVSGDMGFRVLKVDTSNMQNTYYTPDDTQQSNLLGHVENIKVDRVPEDLLFHVLLDWGLDLALPIVTEVVAGKAVFFVDGNALAACFDTGVTDELVREIAKRKPLRAVFRDASYGSDSVKINVEQIFRLLSPETEVRSI